MEEAGSGFVPTTRWQQLQGLFRAIDEGRPDLHVNAYNGGLFAYDPELEALGVPDVLFDDALTLAGYDFRSELNVNLLGRVFEQSISDLEALHAAIEDREPPERSKRKEEGVFYTPEFITRFIVQQTVGAWLDEQFDRLLGEHDPEALPESYTRKREEAERKLWHGYQDVLRQMKVVDPACGSGAFLVAAFDYLYGEYKRVNRQLARLEGGQQSLFDLDRQILQENLYGVDLNSESVEITRLSLWLKTARTDKPLTSLDHTIRSGDSVVAPPGEEAPAPLREAFAGLPEETRRRAFDWEDAFPEVTGRGGFDCVLGNPPYVRGEWITPLKPYLEEAYETYHGTADLYTYFYERGIKLLAPGGKLAYIASNKWLKAGYGEPLRRYFAEHTVFEALVDFGHAPIFEGADTFPCVVVARPPLADEVAERTNGVAKHAPAAHVQLARVPRERLDDISLPQYVEEEAFRVPWGRFTASQWSLEPPEVDELMERLRREHEPLATWAGVEPYRGVVTGLNKAFLIDQETRDRLVREDARSAEVLKPFLRGSNVHRWVPEWEGEWMVALASSANKTWPWTDADKPENVFRQTYPAIWQHFEPLRERMIKRYDQGEYWWELRSCSYYELFDAPKIVYQEIQFHPQYALDRDGFYGNNKMFLLPTEDRYLLAVLNSPLMWWFNWRHLPHMKDDALSPAGYRMVEVPIAEPGDAVREAAESKADRLVELAAADRDATAALLEWLRVEHGVEKHGRKLSGPAAIDVDTFAREVKKRGQHSRLSPALLKEVQAAHADHVRGVEERRGEAAGLEQELSQLVFEAYGLTAEEQSLVWKTAPPRMPITSPA